jgi:hypothetical protein
MPSLFTITNTFLKINAYLESRARGVIDSLDCPKLCEAFLGNTSVLLILSSSRDSIYLGRKLLR